MLEKLVFTIESVLSTRFHISTCFASWDCKFSSHSKGSKTYVLPLWSRRVSIPLSRLTEITLNLLERQTSFFFSFLFLICYFVTPPKKLTHAIEQKPNHLHK